MSEQPRNDGTQRGQPAGQTPQPQNVPQQPGAQPQRPIRVIRVPKGKQVRVVRIPRQPGVPGATPPAGAVPPAAVGSGSHSANSRPVGATPTPAGSHSTAGQSRQVVVRRQRGKKRRNLMPVLIASLALLGGGTYTLWRSSVSFDGAQVTAGDLDLKVTDELKWYDVSPDRTDSDPALVAALNAYTNGEGFYNEFINVLDGREPPLPGRSSFTSAHVIDCLDDKICPDGNTWKMVPGDTIVGLVKARMTLEGDNLVAGLGFDCDGSSVGEYGELVSGNIADLVTAKTDLYVDPDTDEGTDYDISPVNFAALGGIRTNYLGYFEAPGAGQDDGVLDADWELPWGSGTPGLPAVITLGHSPTAPRESVGVGDVTLMITIHFSENATERELATLPLAEVFSGRLSLSQVRGLDTPGQFVQSAP